VGALIRAARESKAMSQMEVVAKLQLFGWDLGRTTWTKIELGERTVTDCELFAIAEVLGLDLGGLFSQMQRPAVRKVLCSLQR
jgi:transcriptional regulator with XRE-family HTH domain